MSSSFKFTMNYSQPGWKSRS